MVARSPNPSNQLEQELLGNHSHLAVIVDTKCKDVVECRLR